MCEVVLACVYVCVCEIHGKEKGFMGDVVTGEGLSQGSPLAQAPK